MRVIAVRLGACLVAAAAVGGCTTTVSGSASVAPSASAAAPAPPPAAPLPAAPLPLAPPPAAPAPAAPAAPPAAAPAPGGFSDPGRRFRIDPPSGWAGDTSGVQGTAVVFRDPTPTLVGGRPFNANINVLAGTTAAGLDATLAAARRELQTLPAYTSTTDEPAVLSDGTAAHLLGGTFTDRGSGAQLRNLQIYAVRGRSSVIATGTAPAPSWASYSGVFDAALRTLTVAG